MPARDYDVGAVVPASTSSSTPRQPRRSIADMAAAMKGLEKALQDFGNNAYDGRRRRSTATSSRSVTPPPRSPANSCVAGVTGAIQVWRRPVRRPGSRLRASGCRCAGGAARSQGWVSRRRHCHQPGHETRKLVGGLSLGTFLGTAGDDFAQGPGAGAAALPARPHQHQP